MHGMRQDLYGIEHFAILVNFVMQVRPCRAACAAYCANEGLGIDLRVGGHMALAQVCVPREKVFGVFDFNHVAKVGVPL